MRRRRRPAAECRRGGTSATLLCAVVVVEESVEFEAAYENYDEQCCPDKGAVVAFFPRARLAVVAAHLYGTNAHGVPECKFDAYRFQQLARIHRGMKNLSAPDLPSVSSSKSESIVLRILAFIYMGIKDSSCTCSSLSPNFALPASWSLHFMGEPSTRMRRGRGGTTR